MMMVKFHWHHSTFVKSIFAFLWTLSELSDRNAVPRGCECRQQLAVCGNKNDLCIERVGLQSLARPI